MPRRRKRIGSPNGIRQGRLAMINHVIRIVTDIVTTTESVTEIEKVIVGVREIRPATVTKAVTDRVKLRLQKKKKIRVKTKEAMTMPQKRQANKDSDILAALLYNKMIFNYSLVVYMHNSEVHTEKLLKQFLCISKATRSFTESFMYK